MARQSSLNLDSLPTVVRLLAFFFLLLGLTSPAQVPVRTQRQAPTRSAQLNNRASATVKPLFQPPILYDSGGNGGGGCCRALAVADINGDGHPDVVVANELSGTVGVLLNNGDGTFQPAVTYAVTDVLGGPYPSAVAIADVNGDGRPDLIVAIFTSGSPGSVAVLMGNGDGTFQSPVTYSSGGVQANDVIVADVNRDGMPDLVVANSGDAIAVLLGNGDGTFAAPLRTNILPSLGIAVADVNNDGKLDLLTTGYVDNTVRVSLGNGDGTFQPEVAYGSSGPGAFELAVADLNSDGKPDVVVGTDWGGVVAVLLGNGDGTFQPAIVYDLGGWEGGSVLAVTDVDGDGKLDILVSQFYIDTVSVLLGNGDGTFQPAIAYHSGYDGPISVVVADVNGDGAPDVLVRNVGSTASGDGNVAVLLNNSGPRTPTTTSVVSALNPSVFGQAVAFTIQVRSNSGTPTGTAQILNDLMVAGSGTLDNGSVSIPVSTLPAGTDSIIASYLGGGWFAASKSSPLIQMVTKAATTTSLSSSLNPAATGHAVTFSATVVGQFGGVATGTVMFMAGSQSLGSGTLSGNVATLTTSFATSGTYSITAQYHGDSNNTGSTSGTFSERIIVLTTTSLTSSLNPSFAGQAVTFTATVTSSSGTPPNGETITFYNGTTVMGTAQLSGGGAALTTSALPSGIFTIKASYPGDSNFAPSTSPGLRQVVNSTTKSATTTTLVSSLNPSIYGQKVILTATVTTSGPVPPTGQVVFTWSGHTIGSAALNSSGIATLTKSNLNADLYPLTAVYRGDTNNLGSTSPVLNQTVLQTSSAATISSSLNPSAQGQAVTFTAKVTSPTVTPAGPATFKAGTTVLGTVQLSGGKASYTTTSLPAGSTMIKVTYNGDSNIKGSSAVVTQVVKP